MAQCLGAYSALTEYWSSLFTTTCNSSFQGLDILSGLIGSSTPVSIPTHRHAHLYTQLDSKINIVKRLYVS